MKHPVRIYYRKKKTKTIIEGKENNKTVFIWTLPAPEKLLMLLQSNASYFPVAKYNKIIEKIRRLDKKTRGIKKEAS